MDAHAKANVDDVTENVLFQREKLLAMAELLFPSPGEEGKESGEESEESGIGETGSDGSSSMGRGEEEGRGRSRRPHR